MKRLENWIKLATLAALAFVLSCQNLDFSGEIPGWTKSGVAADDFEMGIDSSVVVTGGGAAFIRGKNARTLGYGSLSQRVRADRYRGQRVRLSAMVRSEDVKDSGGLWMRVDSKTGETLAFDTMMNQNTRGSHEWARKEIVLDVANEAEAVSFGLRLIGKGTVWMDDVSLEIVPSTVATTDMMLPGGWFPAGSAPDKYAMGVDATPAVEGSKRTAYIRSKQEIKQEFGTLVNTVSAEPYRGKRVRLSGLVSAEDVTDWGGLWLRVDGPAFRILGFDNMQDRPIKGTAPWTRYEVVLDVLDEAELLAFGTLLSGTGTLHMADVAIEEVDDSVPVTRPAFRRNETPKVPETHPDGFFPAGNAWGDYDMTGDPASSAGARIASKTGESEGFGTLMTTVDATPYQGKKIRVSGRLSAHGVRGWAGLWARVDGPRPVAFDNMQNRPVRGTTEAQTCEVVLEVSPTATRIAFGALLSGGGNIDVTDLKVEPALPDEKPTDLVQQPKAPLDAPANLGFED